MEVSDALAAAAACLRLVERELLLFAAFWFVIGALDELGVDVCWLWLRLTARARDQTITARAATAPLRGCMAVFIAAWQEAEVIGHTVVHALQAWRQDDFTLYVGCYGNDPDTVAAVIAATGNDPRVRIVISRQSGPTTKADCLNHIYAALHEDERRRGMSFRAIVLHDAEDMVHPAELAVIDSGLDHADFVQLPVRPELQPASPWVGNHYADEFAESHGKGLVVRDALGAAIPAAGVGCGFSREMVARIARRRGGEGAPFSAECLTEDYELGLLVRREGGSARFLRVRDEAGALVATRAYFPASIDTAVRQKSRWIHGIAFQGWDRMGWGRGYADLWMALRDRRGPLTALVLTCGYLLVVIEGILALAGFAGAHAQLAASPGLRAMVHACAAALLWRCVMRFAFTTRDYGVVEGLGALMRIPVANFIAILAGRRALWGYLATLRGDPVTWEKTRHDHHPAQAASSGGVR
ncbi:glycosyl transferase family protein [Novosphingobium sp. Leaf2]|uniref:glycosyl transferase family protein n=1 Tax=Novosphingobium sp. Leaf2 TaxID=1735670 RepID=UPI000AF375BE|nr:glycosyl transferase family protein [Novosphingobium sp. Leaf2]